MQAEGIKEEIKKIIGEQVQFEGHFDLVVGNMPEKMQLNLLEWVKKCKEQELDPKPSPNFRELLVFFFKPYITNVRGILTKRKNSYFIALFLDKHNYYDRERRKLGFR